MKITQEIEGDATASIDTPWFTGLATTKNARKEKGRYKADKIHIHINAYGGSIDLVGTGYSRPVLK